MYRVQVRKFHCNAIRRRGQNLTEKIIQNYSNSTKKVYSGDFVTITPKYCMSHDNSWPIATKFLNLGAQKIKNKGQIINTLDHDIQNKSPKNLQKYANIENFAKKYGTTFYPAGTGIGHQIMIEQGYAFPLNLTVASDSHSNTYGGVGALGTPIVRTDGAAIWATGQTWWQIPKVAKVRLINKLPTNISGKDIIVALCGIFNNDEVLNHAIEFVGDEETLSHLPIDYRLTIANMTTEWGALSGLFPIDKTLINWYRNRAEVVNREMQHPRINDITISNLEKMFNSAESKPDNDAHYAKTITVDLSTLTYFVSGPNTVKVSNTVNKLSDDNIKIDKAYLVSCTNSRLSDLKEAAQVIKANPNGEINKFAPHVEFYVAAASKEIENEARNIGVWDTLLQAGAIPLPSGCGPCIGLGKGLLEPGEVGISATNRNFKGRMGSKDALAYLASPSVVTASAIMGKIASPDEIYNTKSTNYDGVKTTIIENELPDGQQASDDSPVEILEGFPEEVTGELVFCDADNINTDGIYPGKYTYQDDITKDVMAKVCMENYDSQFPSIVKKGDILISGYNFGTGSSREQAATSLLAKGVPLVVCGSFSNTFSRNAINNALLTFEVPELLKKLRETYGNDKKLTRRTGWFLKWDVANARVSVTEGSLDGPVIFEQQVGKLGKNLQEIIVKGGLENWIKAQL
ncbi:hypothetical protein KAFR_0E02730 [Kazachstania africana CBS 2517]|uniref:Homoaconitase, mitochondrial n=1 Tax=Kazachstania africana (strain ATCC 22294 / BCRC 22015 / CBS 2517 / CECT 1963 / NBRC 1671 / NRRL Y-8276) TaxID=1071382 RepID=H2AVM5_KAZAF|nr:hypothetical protein KAFR_0E02730 [Kazachstania africana CBS 2517]CCF58425.1 hypothetical protein KAFR_0E02730 [Kazachstania africana CBS 2517]